MGFVAVNFMVLKNTRAKIIAVDFDGKGDFQDCHNAMLMQL